VAEVFHALGGASKLAGASRDRAFFSGCSCLANDRRVQRARTFGRETIRLRVRGPLFQHDTQDLRDDITPALDLDGVADAHVEARDLSALCKVAFCTTTPPTVTGSSFATGVSAPVRPT
jgi:hypothetical protein